MSTDRQSAAAPPANGPSAAAAPPSTTSNHQQNDAPTKPVSTAPALSAASPSPMSAPQFPGFSASTEEILRRVSANASAHAGTAGWEAAREQVLKAMVTSDKIATPSPVVAANNRKGRGSAKMGPSRLDVAGDSSATPVSAASPAASRGRGGGRPRGRGGKAAKGGKRKRDADTPDSEDDSDISSSYTPLPTKTKSGRSINKPTQFVPVLPSPTTAPKRKRPLRRPTETSVCKVCMRGHSPATNMIVFCDGCNTGFHQYCHDPPIEKEVIQVAEKEWHCSKCAGSKPKRLDDAVPDVTQLFAGDFLTMDEKRAYFMTLSTSKLTELLLHATSIHPSLPVFAPNARALLTATTIPHSNQTEAPTNSTTTNGATTTPSAFLPPPAVQAPSAPSPAIVPTTTINPDPEPDPYDGYDSDPPAHYPKSGNGLARTLRPEADDLQWLVDDNLEVFSHVYNSDGHGLNGFSMDGGLDGAAA